MAMKAMAMMAMASATTWPHIYVSTGLGLRKAPGKGVKTGGNKSKKAHAKWVLMLEAEVLRDSADQAVFAMPLR